MQSSDIERIQLDLFSCRSHWHILPQYHCKFAFKLSQNYIFWEIENLPAALLYRNIQFSSLCFIGKIRNSFKLSMRISSYGCTREVWRARKMRKSSSRRSREQLKLFVCSSNFSSASITRYTHS